MDARSCGFLVATVAVAAAVVGMYFFSHQAHAKPSTPQLAPQQAWADVQITTDNETGCQYIMYGTGLFPRLGSDGQPMCARRRP